VTVRDRRLAAKRHVARAVRDASARCYVELNHDVGRTVLLCSSGRSGSTWLANVLNYRREYRLLFEPLRRDRVPVASCVRYGQYLPPNVEGGAVGRAVDSVLRGEVRALWADRYNRTRLVRRRLVKEIRATNLLPWIRGRYPELPLVYLFRHPHAVAASFTRLGWDDYLSEFLVQDELMAALASQAPLIEDVVATGDAFERHALRWCLENALPLRLLRRGDVHVVFYEDAVADPERELRRLFAYLGKEWDDRVLDSVPVFSQTTFPDRDAAGEHLAASARTQELLRAFDLDRLYGSEEGPRLSPDDVLADPRPAATATRR
jgi:hypothetical protein